MTPEKPVPLEQEFAAALGLFDSRPRAADVVERVAVLARLGGAVLLGENRTVTTAVLISLVREVQEATWDSRIVVGARSEQIAREVCPTDYGELVGLALDLGLAQTPLPGGGLVEVMRALRSPVRKRLEAVACKLLHHVAGDCRVQLLDVQRGSSG